MWLLSETAIWRLSSVTRTKFVRICKGCQYQRYARDSSASPYWRDPALWTGENKYVYSSLLQLDGMIFLEDTCNARMRVRMLRLRRSWSSRRGEVLLHWGGRWVQIGRDDDDVDHGCYYLRHSLNALSKDYSIHELQNSSQDEIFSEKFDNNPEVVFTSCVSTCPSQKSNDKQDACH